MVIEKRDGTLWADIFWDDLSANTRAELFALMGDNGNFDVSPLASVNVGHEDDEVDSRQRIRAKATDNNWIDGYIDGLRFQAKVFDTGSKHGVDNGRVSKLTVWRSDTPLNAVLNYDRGWDKKPENDEQEALLRELLDYLEGLPTGQSPE
jgi:hypothetical protein